jgi:hypothetical protein
MRVLEQKASAMQGSLQHITENEARAPWGADMCAASNKQINTECGVWRQRINQKPCLTSSVQRPRRRAVRRDRHLATAVAAGSQTHSSLLGTCCRALLCRQSCALRLLASLGVHNQSIWLRSD